MTEMVKRVARAMYETQHSKPSDEQWAQIYAWHTDAGRSWHVVEQATAAIQAMRQPSREMISAVPGDRRSFADDDWKAMIDKALSP